MNSKRIWRATLPLALMFALGSAHAGSDDGARYAVLAPDSSVSEAVLRGAIAPLFDEDKVGITQSLLVMHKGKTVAERYGEGIGPETKLLSRSIAKSVTAVLVGLMVSDGRLALDSPVPLDRWDRPGDPRGGITLRHLLTMTSGLAHREAGEPLATSDTVRMLFTDGARDMANFAEGKPMATQPGARFSYSTPDYVILADLMTRMLTDSTNPRTRRDAMQEFISGRLSDPAGLKYLTPEYDAHGTMIGGAMMYATTRNYARFGQFLLNRGRIDGRQILSPRWVEFMTHPSRLNPAYGGGVWLNSGKADGPLFNGAGPRGIFACVGRNGQYVIISPRQRLVIVRMGLTGEDDAELRDALRRLVEAFPES